MGTGSTRTSSRRHRSSVHAAAQWAQQEAQASARVICTGSCRTDDIAQIRASQPQLPTMAGGDVVGIDGDVDMVERAAAKDEDPKFAADVAH